MSKTIKTETLTLTTNKDDVLKAAAEQIYLGLASIGEAAEGFAKDDCPVGTPESTGIAGYIGGRLRDSITYATKMEQSKAGSKAQAGDSKTRSRPEELSLYIGTNVEYAIYVETMDSVKHKTGKAHFLRDSAANHSEAYKRIMLAALKAGEK